MQYRSSWSLLICSNCTFMVCMKWAAWGAVPPLYLPKPLTPNLLHQKPQITHSHTMLTKVNPVIRSKHSLCDHSAGSLLHPINGGGGREGFHWIPSLGSKPGGHKHEHHITIFSTILDSLQVTVCYYSGYPPPPKVISHSVGPGLGNQNQSVTELMTASRGRLTLSIIWLYYYDIILYYV